jgi:hypothetical protein
MAETPTPQDLIGRIPEDFVDIVGRFIGDSDINTELQEVKELMPASPVVALIANHLGINTEPLPTHELDQAKAWLDEQIRWQDRSVAVQKKLAEKAPFGEEQAIKGEIPMWMNAKWAPMLLFQWSDGLRDAVLQAEEYVEEVL